MSRTSFLLLALGVAAAALCVAPLAGHTGDAHGYWVPWQRATVGFRPWNAYSIAECNYPPVVLYLLSVLEAARGALALKGPGPANLLLLKLPNLAATFVGAACLFRAFRDELGVGRALSVGAAWLVSPALFVNAAIWCQWDALLALFGLLAMLAFRAGRPFRAGAWVGLAVATKVQAAFLLPVLPIYWIATRDWRAALRGAAGGAVALVVCFAPMAAAGRLREATAVYAGSVDTFPFRSLNAWNPWALSSAAELRDAGGSRAKARRAMSDARPVTDSLSVPWLTHKRLGLALFAAYVVALLAVVVKRRSPADVLVATSLCGVAMFLLLTQMHERYGMPPAAMMAPWLPRGRAYRVHYWFWSSSAALNQLFVLGRYGFLGVLEAWFDAHFTHAAIVGACLNTLAFAHLSWLFWRSREPEPEMPSA